MFEILGACACFEVRLLGFLIPGSLPTIVGHQPQFPHL